MMSAAVLADLRRLLGAILACRAVNGETRREAALLQLKADSLVGPLGLRAWLDRF